MTNDLHKRIQSPVSQAGDGEVAALEHEKALLIERYLHLQDQVDEFNEMIYQVCCEIEATNLKIARARAKTTSKAGQPNGHRHNNGHSKPD